MATSAVGNRRRRQKSGGGGARAKGGGGAGATGSAVAGAAVAEQLRRGARAVTDEAARRADTLRQLARDEVGRLVDAQRAKAAAKVRAVGGAVEKAARLLRAVRGDGVAGYVGAVGGAAERTAAYIEEADLAEVAEDVSGVMRRHPVLVAGSLLLAGVAVGRLLRLGALDGAGGVEEGGEEEEGREEREDDNDA